MNRNIKMYIREYKCKLEFWDNTNVLKMHNKIKKSKFKKIYNWLLGICININFIFKYLNSKINIKKIEEGSFICLLPIDTNIIKTNKLVKYLFEKNIKNIEKVIYKYNIRHIILSKNLEQFEEIKRICNIKNVNIIQDRNLLKFMIKNVLEYIFNIIKEPLENQNIHILVKENSKMNIDIIEHISNNVKCAYIVTNEIKKFQKLEKYLYEKKGVMTVVSNNKRKSLNKAKVIINLDFSEEELLQYQISRNFIIINISDNIINLEKSFDGIIINSLEIEKINIKCINNSEYFNNERLYTSYIIEKDYEDIIKKINEDKVIINHLIGKRGEIQKNEYAKIT